MSSTKSSWHHATVNHAKSALIKRCYRKLGKSDRRSKFRKMTGLLVLFAVCTGARHTLQADVYQWEYIDSADPSVGKQQSATLAPDGEGANLDGVTGLISRDLTKAYLFRANMRRFRVGSTIFDDAYLAEADMYNLQGDDLVARGADMSGSTLQVARLEDANLAMTSFVGANLTEAYLNGAILADADFTAAIIAGARFGNTTNIGFSATQLYSSASYQAGDLGTIVLTGNDLSGWDFSGQQMIGSKLENTQLAAANFNDAIIKDAGFAGSNLTAAQLYSTASYRAGDLGRILLFTQDLEGWDFSGQSMIRAELAHANVNQTNFQGADLTLATIGKQFESYQATNFAGANLTSLRVEPQTEWQVANFDGANLTEADFETTAFVDSTFNDAIIPGINLNGAFSRGFTIANLYSTASYKSRSLPGVILDHNDLSGAIFSDADLSSAQFVLATLDNADFQRANLEGARLHRASLLGANFQDANLNGAAVDADQFNGARFQRANLENAFFGDADLTGADLTDAVIRGASFVDANPAIISAMQFYSTASYKSGDLGPISIKGDFRGWDFRNQDLGGARFGRYSQLEGALWTGSTLRDTLFFVNSLQAADFSQADVRAAQFIVSDLQGADFRDNDLSDIYFDEPSLVNARFDGVILHRGRLIDADLTGASFVGADLRYSEFEGSTFSDTDFSNAEVRHADFTNAVDGGFTLSNLMSTHSYQERDLTGIRLISNDLTGIDLESFNLSDADFYQSDLTDASFASADLTNTNFHYATLAGADFTDATLHSTNLERATNGGFVALQLYSTQSYQQRKLHGVILDYSDLTGWNFSNVDLSNSSFAQANLANVNFDGAIVESVDFGVHSTLGITAEQLYSTQSYQQKILVGVGFRRNNLAGWDLSGQNLHDADFEDAILTDVNFEDAWIDGANFEDTVSKGWTLEQLMSTGSYKNRDLRNVDFSGNTLESWTFRDQYLGNASFANCHTVGLVDFTRADLRGAVLAGQFFSSSGTQNAILPAGNVEGLYLNSGERMLIRDHDPIPGEDEPGPLGILVEEFFDIRPANSILQFVFEQDEWNSTIAFSPNIPITLGGQLVLSFAPGTDLQSQIDRSFSLFDWADADPTGTFQIVSDPRFTWDTSQLYSNGTVQLLAVVPEPSTAIMCAVAVLLLFMKCSAENKKPSSARLEPATRNVSNLC